MQGQLLSIFGLFSDWFGDLEHEDKSLTALQMSMRAGLIFFLALLTVRLAGRRAFGMRTPFDTVVSLLLGATLSRAIVGATSFTGVLAACCVLVGMHRLLAWATVQKPALGRFINGRSLLLYHRGTKHKANMQSGLVNEADLESAVRQKGHVNSLSDIEAAYIEANGEISIIKKERVNAQPNDYYTS
jgi:uncharacterized membrane protein YcaP (DUF421 family)